MAEHFIPGTVPILSRYGGAFIGTLDTVRAVGRDLHFTGTVVEYLDLVERLRCGSIPVSIETAWALRLCLADLTTRTPRASP